MVLGRADISPMKQHRTFHQHLPDAQTSKMISAALHQPESISKCFYLMTVCFSNLSFMNADRQTAYAYCSPQIKIEVALTSIGPYGCFQKTTQIIHCNKVFHYKPSILGYHYFWKHPYQNSCSTRCCPFFNDHFLDTKMDQLTSTLPCSSRFACPFSDLEMKPSSTSSKHNTLSHFKPYMP